MIGDCICCGGDFILSTKKLYPEASVEFECLICGCRARTERMGNDDPS